ncbi:hypothetical protein LTS18_001010 [Coniosporium uncinatum]|uniref:Uncharacterized protein n=1 Tax=Coniosporium uncinatum TaxID=93489 RepID=A0ACC3DFI4_9PEZI|nr:hypothetical protein LTS18_001010 [Coniosporium uncinatum]
MAFGQGQSRSPSQSTTASNNAVMYNSQMDNRWEISTQQHRTPTGSQAPPNQSAFQQQYSNRQHAQNFDDIHLQNGNSPPAQEQYPSQAHQTQELPYRPGQYPPGFNSYENDNGPPASRQSTQQQRSQLKDARKFNDAYEDQGAAGSSGAGKRVMEFFRRRGRGSMSYNK